MSIEHLADPERTLDMLRDTVAAIVAELDGVEWSPDTLNAIADHLRAAGWAIREPIEITEEDAQ